MLYSKLQSMKNNTEFIQRTTESGQTDKFHECHRLNYFEDNKGSDCMSRQLLYYYVLQCLKYALYLDLRREKCGFQIIEKAKHFLKI